MEFRFAHLADYAGDGASGKMIVVGIFDNVFVGPDRPVVLPPFYLVARFEAHVTEGTQHALEIRFTDMDGNDVIPRGKLPINFGPRGPGRPLQANVYAQLSGVQVPDVGEYAFHLFIDDRRLGDLQLRVTSRQNAPSS